MALHMRWIDPFSTLNFQMLLLINRGVLTLFIKLSKSLIAVIEKKRKIYVLINS